METSWAAVKMGLTGYIIPFMFVFSPSLLLMGDFVTISTAAITSILGVICLAGWLHEYFFFGRARWWERILLIAAALVLIKPGAMSDLIGLGLIALIVVSQLMLRPASPISNKESA
ncbi:MAG: DUF3394 domain-containing protein, partial [Polaromonas sp.]